MRALGCVLLAVLLVAGCGSGEPATDAAAVRVHEAWVKAAGDGMTAAFAHLTNEADREVRITSAATPVAARVELHEVVRDGGAATMQQKAGGLVLPARSTTELTPGGDHLMLMDLTGPLTPGSDIEITATLDDGSTLAITAQVREFPGADEHYGGGHG
ncbi:copper chaperone PCu(A)C [Mycolicibacterium litorale]|uniref:copper chaperone PCu(A)C n=1 Tax=Mycolicibacterium litorale TaxID=758802 RepID=UPI003CF2182B